MSRVIFDIHKEIYDLLKNENSKEYKEMKNLLREAFDMAKKMTKKVCEYEKREWDGENLKIEG